MLIYNEEQRLELRTQLMADSHFNPITLFQRLDHSACGYLTHFDLLDFLKSQGIIKIGKPELKLFISQDKTSYASMLKKIVT